MTGVLLCHDHERRNPFRMDMVPPRPTRARQFTVLHIRRCRDAPSMAVEFL